MSWLKRAVEVMVVFVVLPMIVFFFGAIAFTLIAGLGPYLGGLLGAWMLFALGLPLLAGVITPSEIAANVRSRLRSSRYYEGEPLSDLPPRTDAARASRTRMEHFWRWLRRRPGRATSAG